MGQRLYEIEQWMKDALKEFIETLQPLTDKIHHEQDHREEWFRAFFRLNQDIVKQAIAITRISHNHYLRIT